VSQGGEQERDEISRDYSQAKCMQLTACSTQQGESALARMAAGPKSSGAASTGVDFLPLFARAALLKITSHFTLIKKTKTRLERRFLPRARARSLKLIINHVVIKNTAPLSTHTQPTPNLYKVRAKNGGARWC
jgi:hypothetical protein